MILLGGIASERPLVFLMDALDALGAPYLFFNQRRCADCKIDLRVGPDGASGTLRLQHDVCDLRDISAVYVRLMDDRLLPELKSEPEGSPARRHARAFHDTFYRWIEVADARVVNRSDPQGSNGSKPYQAQLITSYGLRVPETLITNDPAEVLAFRRAHGTIIYKSMSGVRSIVKALDDQDLARIEDIGWCPVQFQELVPGDDVRVHVIGNDVHATEIVSDVTDYRYARQMGGSASLRAREVPDILAARCVALTAGLGLEFAGIDLRIGPDGTATCFEVNPSPAFSYYQANTGQPIAETLARHLARGARSHTSACRASKRATV
jgi:glutathione synthase/RimK-type ligase-like ATP-grasp enzyme